MLYIFIFLIGVVISSIFYLILKCQKIKNFFNLENREVTSTPNLYDVKTHMNYAVEIAPAYDYYLYEFCPYRNQFNQSYECKVWNCPACNSYSNLICKGLIFKENIEEKEKWKTEKN